MFLVVCPVPSTFPIGQSRFHIDCQFDYELEIARIELHLKLKLCARASFFLIISSFKRQETVNVFLLVFSEI